VDSSPVPDPRYCGCDHVPCEHRPACSTPRCHNPAYCDGLCNECFHEWLHNGGAACHGESVVAQLRLGQWDNVVVQGPNPTGFCTVDHPAPRVAADLIEALTGALERALECLAGDETFTPESVIALGCEALAKVRGEA
jgi:hypothetical protein